MTKANTYRDGRVHVLREKCATCVFRSGNLMQLQPGRVAGMVKEATADESGSIVCHSTLNTKPKRNAVCRGFFDRHATTALQLADRMGLIEFDELPKETT